MKTTVLASTFAGALLATLLGAADARAWGLHAGDTVGTGDNFVYGEAGWPGVTAGFAHGFSDALELGGRLDVLYGYESSLHRTALVNSFGLGFVGTLRYTLVRQEKLSLEAHIFPGLRFDSLSPNVFFGLQFPVGVEAGFKISREAIVSAGVDVGLFADFTNHGYFVFEPLVGPGFEYHVTERITFGAVTRFGGAIFAAPPVLRENAFAFRLQGFFGYRL